MNKNKVVLLGGVVVMTIMMTLNSVKVTAQLSEEVVKKTPDLPGQIMVDFGFNLTSAEPYEMRNNWFRSKSLGIYFVKPFELSKNVTFRPGLGVSLEKFGHKDNPKYIDYVLDGTGNGGVIMGYDSIIGGNIKKNQLAVNSVELPMEIRINFKGNEKKDGLYLALGGSAAFLFESHTKMKYEDFYGRKRKQKVRTDFRISKVRMGAYARFGFRNVGLFYKYYFTDFFLSDGPAGTEDMKYSTIGLTITGF